jgi:hypothetical protein
MSQTKAQLLGPVLGDVNYDSGTFFVDSTNNRIGIGTTTPTSALHVIGAGTFSSTLSASTFSGSGASLTSIPNSALVNSTISGVSLGSNLNTLSLATSTFLTGSATYNGSGAATFTVATNATSANTASTIVARDASGNFSAGTITASLNGNASLAGLLSSFDDRAVTPNDIGSSRFQFGFTSWANNNTSPYADFLHLRSYTDSSGGSDNLVMFRKDSIGMRIYQQSFGSTSAYSTFADVILSTGGTFTGQIQSTRSNSTTTGDGQIYLNGLNGNRIDFNTNGVAAPAFTTRSAGTKVVLYPSISASNADYALGIESSTLWSSVPSTSQQFKWYAGTTNVATLTGAGNLSVTGSTTSTNFADTTGSYNVNLGSGGSEGRGLVAGYSGGSYGGIGYNVRHTTTGGSWIAPLTDTSSYILFTAGGFAFYGAAGGAAGRTLSYSTLASLNSSGNLSVTGSVTATSFSGSLSGNASTASNISNTGTVTLASATESNSIYITQPSYTTDQPVKLLNFDWYGNTWSIGNIRSGSTGSNGLGVYISGSERARFISTGLKVQRDLYISGNTGGNYGNRLVVGNTDTAYTLQDTNLRPTIQAHGAYPVISLNHTITSNTSHGPTLQFTCNGTGNQFVIGTTGNGSRLDIGTSFSGDWNPHNGIANHSGTTHMSFTTSGNVGIGTLSPTVKLQVVGRVYASDYGYAREFAYDAPASPDGSGYVWIRASMGGFNGGGDIVKFSFNRSINANSNNPYGGPTLDVTGAYSREWHSGQEFFTATYGYHGAVPGSGWVLNAGPRDLAGGGPWFYMRVWAGVQYIFRYPLSSGYINPSWEQTTDPGSVPTLNWGFNVLGNLAAISASQSITAGGNITAYGSVSDRKLKENINPLSCTLDKVLQLNPVTFDWKEETQESKIVGLKEDIGLIAQEVQEVFPELVREGSDGCLAIRERGLTAILIQAIKEQQKQIDNLNIEIENIKREG